MSLNMDQQHGTTSQNYYLYKSKYGGLVQRVHPFLGRENYRSAAATYVARARPQTYRSSRSSAPARCSNVMNVQPATSQQTAVRALSQQERRAE